MSKIKKDNYIKENIELIQKKKQWTRDTKTQRDNNQIPFRNHTEITEYLFYRLHKFSKSKRKKMVKEWYKKDYVLNKTIDIANEYLVYDTHLKEMLKTMLKEQLLSYYNEQRINSLSSLIMENLTLELGNKSEYGLKVLKTQIKKVLPNSIYFSLNAGFYKNLKNVKPGEDSTFFGQAAQFLFLARALRAGYNASNVDLPSSKYDAILDTGNNKTVKIQIKGTESNKISFFTRARGGQGIDSNDKTNQQTRITSEWCDFYVAVDHLVGICYIIPMKDIDNNFNDKEAKSVKLSSLKNYKEAWHLFD